MKCKFFYLSKKNKLQLKKIEKIKKYYLGKTIGIIIFDGNFLT